MWEASVESETTASPSDVWTLWADPDRWQEWNEQIASVSLEGPLEQGAKARIRFKRSPRPLTFEVTALEPGRLLTDETRFPGARMGHEHRIEQIGGRTRISNRLYFAGPLERLYALLMGWRMRRAVASFIERERELAEGARGAPAR